MQALLDTFAAIPNLTKWLKNHPSVAAAIKWQFQVPAGGTMMMRTRPANADMIDWAHWSASQKSDLDAAYVDAAYWLLLGASTPITLPYRGVSDMPTNVVPDLSDDTAPVRQWMAPTDMWALYVAYVGFSLALETTQQLPWSITTYDAHQLRYLLDSRTMGWEEQGTTPIFVLGTIDSFNPLPMDRSENLPETAFSHPMWIYQWMMAQAAATMPGASPIIGPTPLATVGGVLQWMRVNMLHFGDVSFPQNYGQNYGSFETIWGYRGFVPLSKITAGTLDPNTPWSGVAHWTAGCHGSVGFLCATLRAVNVPVQPVWVDGHELACFLTDKLYLDHGDDPYDTHVKYEYASSPILNVLIDEPTYQARFTTDLTLNVLSSTAAVYSNLGLAATNFH
jgi:hypothetical protein